MKKLFLVLFVSVITFTNVLLAETQREVKMNNVLENIPYQEEGVGKRKLVDEKYLLMMQAALRPGQSVPQHNANSNVHLVVLKGEVVCKSGWFRYCRKRRGIITYC